jgi:2,4-diketo-3-deoxy-L-fuconate hydrolase
MRFANHAGRLTLISSSSGDAIDGARGVDVHAASGGRIPADPQLAFAQWDAVLECARDLPPAGDVVIDRDRLGAPSPRPPQVFGIGLNYADHGAESGLEVPEVPLIFTKLGTAVTGPFHPIPLSTQTADWEVEIVIVIGRRARNIAAAQAWNVVAGLTAGQDISDRDIQWRPPNMPQFGVGKSLPGFSPLGPVLVTPDEFTDRDDLALTCHVNGEQVQRSRSSKMVMPIAELVAYLSTLMPLLPGDVIFTGTPSGVGMSREPPRYLAVGDRLETYVEGVGTMSNRLVAEGAAG